MFDKSSAVASIFQSSGDKTSLGPIAYFSHLCDDFVFFFPFLLEVSPAAMLSEMLLFAAFLDPMTS